MKYCHAWVGYLACANLLARIVWGFFGNRFVRWRAVLPGRGTIAAALREARQLLQSERGEPSLGHGPLGRLSSTLLFALMIMMAGTGLVRAGTDLYYPPFGGSVAEYVAKPGVDATKLGPLDKELLLPERAEKIAKLKQLAGKPHIWGSYALLGWFILHVSGIIVKELRQGGGVLSSMITGRKVFRSGVAPTDD
jgi:Ni/Fe-hydrogenase 1 B-type cytochrome subunit